MNRTQPILPVRPGLPEKATHDYKRNGTTTLFAALEIATGAVTDRCYERHGKAEFLDFLKRVARAYPRRELHIVLDNYHTHKHDEINQWLAKHPRITLHFTPTSGSWLNLVEVFFSIITRQAIRRGSFDSVKALIAAIRAYIDGYNERCQPFVWTKTAEDILPRATRQRTSDAGHGECASRTCRALARCPLLDYEEREAILAVCVDDVDDLEGLAWPSGDHVAGIEVSAGEGERAEFLSFDRDDLEPEHVGERIRTPVPLQAATDASKDRIPAWVLAPPWRSQVEPIGRPERM